jgi:hypothetical protein
MRSIPLAIIPGCREYPFEYERYPKKTVALHFSSLPHKAAAEFYSYLAFPDPLEEKQRKKYSLALSRWAVLEVGKYDKTWNTAEQMICRPFFPAGKTLFEYTNAAASDCGRERNSLS